MIVMRTLFFLKVKLRLDLAWFPRRGSARLELGHNACTDGRRAGARSAASYFSL